MHWHGLRLENRYDGTHETQAPIPVGETFTYQVHVPDPGAYWYHPHIREDYGQEMGLYGNILAIPAASDYWPPANRELLLTLDDILIEDGQIAPFREAETTHVAMGRFGNVMLVAGEPDLSLRRGAARSCASTSPTPRTRASSMSRSRRTDEAGRCRRRPLRAGGACRGGPARAV